MRRFRFAVCVLVFLFANTAFAQASQGEYRIGSKDLLDIHVLEIPELNVERRVADSGAIDLPLLGQVVVAGKTAAEAQGQIEDLLRSKYVNRANVSIVVKEFANKPISIVGAVGKPGSLNVSGRWYLLQALSTAGGISAGAGKKIYVLRTADNGLSDSLEIDRDALLQTSSTLWNIPIFPGDVVNVPPKSTVRIFCLGEVKMPGAHEFDSDDRITLLSVIAKAGGLTDRAAKTISIKRRGADGKDTEMKVHYRAVLNGKEPDPILKADDIVVVPESFL